MSSLQFEWYVVDLDKQETVASEFESEFEALQWIENNGNFEIKVKEGKAFHKSDNITEFVKGMQNNMKIVGKLGGYDYMISDITFSKTGCQNTESKLSEWIEVYNALK